MNQDILNQILKGYITVALWTEEERLREDYDNNNDDEMVFGNDDDNDDELEKLVRLSSNMNKKGFERFTKEDIENDSLIRAYVDIKEFINKVGEETIESAIIDDDVEIERIGHDLWLSRNGHGSGFFDGHYDNDREKIFMDAARKMGSVELYINDNNKLSFSNEHIWENKNTNKMKILINEEDLKYVQESIKNGDVLEEDLKRWFKEKWVDVSRKVDGKHPPCGRSKASTKGYPKCRPSKKVSKETPKTAGSFSKEEKKSMTSQKRRAEKKEPKVGTGNKPTMTKLDENRIINLVINEIKKSDKVIYEDIYGSIENTDYVANDMINEAEYQGRKVQLGKIMQGDIKKFKVYVKNDKGKVVKVNFGFGGKTAKGKVMKIKKNNPERRKSFRARHNCDNPGPRWKPRYWACRTW